MEHLILRIFDNQDLEALSFITDNEEDEAIENGDDDLYNIIDEGEVSRHDSSYWVIEPSKANLGELKALVKLMEEKLGE